MRRRTERHQREREREREREGGRGARKERLHRRKGKEGG